MPARARRAAALTLVACILLAGAGAAVVRRAPGSNGSVATAPLVPVRDATAAAGGPAPVRLQGTLVAMPPLVTPAGIPLALQVVVVAQEGDAAAERRAAPTQLFLTDGDSLVQLAAADADVTFLPLIARGRVDDDGLLPPDVRVYLTADMAGLARAPGARVTVHAIGVESPVIAHGRLELQEGVPTLVPPSGATSLVLTTMSAAEVDRERRRAARRSLALGWALVGAGALGGVGAAVALVGGGRRG